MAFIGPILGALGGAGSALSIGGTILSTVGTIAGASQQAAAQKTQALQDEQRAMAERAKASREAAARYKEQKRIQGDQQAIASADGGSATDPGILDLAGDVGGYGYQQRQGIIAGGENVARGLEDDAKARRASAKSAMIGGFIGAGSTLLSGLSNAGQRYQQFMRPSY